MRERPILFNGDMVRAILAGQKTQTRRVVKPQPPTPEDVRALAGIDYCWLPPSWPGAQHHRVGGPVWAVRKLMGQEPEIVCPFGQPGDRLWLRETWQQVHPLQVLDGRYSQRGYAGIPGPPPVGYRTIYRADGEYPAIYSLGGEPWPYRSLEPFERDGMQAFVDEPRWTPSVHMPRWACRLVLEITAVRVERLQDITSDDVLAEGITTRFKVADAADDLRIQFRDLWNDAGGDWDSNPWVWVIEFKRVEVANG